MLYLILFNIILKIFGMFYFFILYITSHVFDTPAVLSMKLVWGI